MDLPELTSERIAALDERYPPLFRRIPDRLFGPLASPNRMRYWELLCALHGKRFGPDAPLPPGAGFLMAEIVQDIALEMSRRSSHCQRPLCRDADSADHMQSTAPGATAEGLRVCV
ncbi:MAG: hypothetical protein AB1412_09295 [Pseudomonadota bacterium]